MKRMRLFIYLVLFILLPLFAIGQEKAKPTLNIGVNAIRPTLSGSYNYPIVNHIQLQLYTDIGYFEKTNATSSAIRLDEYFYGVGFIPEMKIYPIKRKANDFGFYFSFYSGLWGIYKTEDFDNNPEESEVKRKTGLIIWQLGMGMGYKIKIYKNWFINPFLGFAKTKITPGMTTKFTDPHNLFTGLEELRYIPIVLRYELKVGYAFEL